MYYRYARPAMGSGIACRRCRNEFRTGARFCTRCGQSAAANPARDSLDALADAVGARRHDRPATRRPTGRSSPAVLVAGATAAGLLFTLAVYGVSGMKPGPVVVAPPTESAASMSLAADQPANFTAASPSPAALNPGPPNVVYVPVPVGGAIPGGLPQPGFSRYGYGNAPQSFNGIRPGYRPPNTFLPPGVSRYGQPVGGPAGVYVDSYGRPVHVPN
jgi:hypothetical protein